MEQALPLDDVLFDPSVEETGDISNMTAEEYLSWVRHQASNMPLVSRADVDQTQFKGRQTVYMPSIGDIPASSALYVPDRAWVLDALRRFSDLRAALSLISEKHKSERKIAVPALKDSSGWYAFCFGHPDTTQSAKKSAHDDQSSPAPVHDTDSVRKRKRDLLQSVGIDCTDLDAGEASVTEAGDLVHPTPSTQAAADPNAWTGATNVPPSTSLILQFDQVLTQRLLSHHIDWLRQSGEFSISRTRWLYALLSRLEKPVHQDTAALLRQLYRICAQARAAVEANVSVDSSTGEEYIDDDVLGCINTVSAIAGSYFGQGEEYVDWEEAAESAVGIEEDGDVEYDDDDEGEDQEAYDDGEEECDRDNERVGGGAEDDEEVQGDKLGGKAKPSVLVSSHLPPRPKPQQLLEEGEEDESGVGECDLSNSDIL